MDNEGIDPADEGRVIQVDGVEVLRFERDLAHAPEEVWHTLTDPERTAAWAVRADFEPRAGGAVAFDTGGPEPTRGEVIAWEEPAALAYAWDGYGGRWHVRIAIGETDGGALLTWDHLAPDPHDPDFAAGWHWHLDRLRLLLAGGTPPAVPVDEHFEELQRFYSRAEG